jgi:hypothetical protein
MRKIVINADFGGFSLSHEGCVRARELGLTVILKGETYPDLVEVAGRSYLDSDTERDDPRLVQVVEELGAAAGESYATLKIVEIPEDVDWVLMEYDGSEWIAEAHRTWR